jgi:hypothetical protein
VATDAPAARPQRQQRERRLLAEWLALHHPDEPTQQQVRLGAFTPSISTDGLDRTEIKALGVWRRFADAIVYRRTELLLIEASIPADVGYVSRLELYARLVPLTPELAPYLDRPVALLYLCAIEDPIVTAIAREHGIRVEVYFPPWAVEFTATYESRKQRAKYRGGL